MVALTKLGLSQLQLCLTSIQRFAVWLSTGEGKWAVALKGLIRLGCLVQRLTVYTVATVNSHLPIAQENQPANLCIYYVSNFREKSKQLGEVLQESRRAVACLAKCRSHRNFTSTAALQTFLQSLNLC